MEAQIRRELRAAIAAARPGRGERRPPSAQRRATAGRRPDADDPLLLAILTAFPDRVARRRRGDELLLAGGGSARLSPTSVVRHADLLVAVDIEERSDQDQPLVRLASAVKPEWLFDLFPDRITESRGVEWNRELERVETIDRLLFDGIAIEESSGGAPDPEAAARLLAEKSWAEGLARFADEAEIQAFRRRLDFAARHAHLPRLEDADIRLALEQLCTGLRSFKELAAAAGNGGLLARVKAALRPEDRRLLDAVAPERLALPGGRRVRVHYEPGKPPWAASRLQDFFGLRESPRVGGGAVPVVIHLLAPNQRPVQTTTDLGGFWERLYPKLRTELSRKYPKHAWPLKPPG
jgi:ATP-dependent helicase HrpB